MHTSSLGAICNVAVGAALILLGLILNQYVLEKLIFADRITINNTTLSVVLWIFSASAIMLGIIILYWRRQLDGGAILLSFISMLFSLLLLEFVGRVMSSGADRQSLIVADDVLVIYDPNIGYRYRPSIATTITFFGPENDDLIQTVRFKTNAQGWRSRKDYNAPKEENEFRLAIIGDSFTAGAGSNFSWTDVLESELNNRLDHDHQTSFRVFNFGLGGAGFWHFDRIRQYEISKYDVDMLVIAYIHGDIRRKPTWRWSEIQGGTLMAITCLQPSSIEDRSNCQMCPVATGAELREVGIGRLRDRRDYRCMNAGGSSGSILKPVGLAKIIDGVGISASYYLDSIVGNFEQYALYEGIDETTKIVAAIQEEDQDVVFLHLPLGRSVQESLTDWASTKRLVPELDCPRCLSLAEYVNLGDHAALRDGYVPYDGHHNDQGVAAIGQVAYRALEEGIREALGR